MGDQQKMRASDRDRQQVVERLGRALEDGRLAMEEYVNRMEAAYQAGDLRRPGPAVRGPAARQAGRCRAGDGCAHRSATGRLLPRRLSSRFADST
jgi:hypothetical protein